MWLQGKWDTEDDDQLMDLVETEGQKWADIGQLLQRLPEACRDRWKEIRHGNIRRHGKWDDGETEKLRSVVEGYLAFKQVSSSFPLPPPSPLPRGLGLLPKQKQKQQCKCLLSERHAAVRACT